MAKNTLILWSVLLITVASSRLRADPEPAGSYVVVEIKGDREIDAVHLHERLPEARIVGRAIVRARLTWILVESKRLTFVVVPKDLASKVGLVVGPDFEVATRKAIPLRLIHPYGNADIEVPAELVPHDRDFGLPTKGKALEALLDALPDSGWRSKRAKELAVAGTEKAHLEAHGLQEASTFPVDGRLDNHLSTGQHLRQLEHAVTRALRGRLASPRPGRQR